MVLIQRTWISSTTYYQWYWFSGISELPRYFKSGFNSLTWIQSSPDWVIQRVQVFFFRHKNGVVYGGESFVCAWVGVVILIAWLTKNHFIAWLRWTPNHIYLYWSERIKWGLKGKEGHWVPVDGVGVMNWRQRCKWLIPVRFPNDCIDDFHLYCLLWRDKPRVKENTYIWVSV